MPLAANGTKVCSSKKCHLAGVPQALSEFSSNARRPDGLQCQCKSCLAKANSQWRCAKPKVHKEKIVGAVSMRKNLQGQRFDRLVVIEHAGTRMRRGYKVGLWLCLCDCGKRVLAETNRLASGNKRSCGCLKREIDVLKCRGRRKNLTGRVQGSLRVLGPVCGAVDPLWDAYCDPDLGGCGTRAEFGTKHLRDGRIGCQVCNARSSNSEKALASFVRQYCQDVVAPAGYVLPNRRFVLDVFVPRMRAAIEFDGTYWHTPDNPKQVERDARKDRECAEAGIRLLRVKESDYLTDPDAVHRSVLAFLDECAQAAASPAP